MHVYDGITPITVGPRRYNISHEYINYAYLLLVPRDKVIDILTLWRDKEITEMTSLRGYRIRGILQEGDSRNIISSKNVPSIDTNANSPTKVSKDDRGNNPGADTITSEKAYDITVIPMPEGMSEDKFIHENWDIYWFINMIDVPNRKKLRARFLHIIRWAIDNDVYGGDYPDSMGYLIYAANTINKGYSHDKAVNAIHQRCLYFHHVFKYSLISHVPTSSLKRMRDLT